MASEVPAVLSAVRILERIARDWPEPVASGALIDELGLNRSTCYNILGTLQRAGWAASRGDRGGWSLGPRLLAMARVSEDWMSEIVEQELDAYSRRLGCIVFAVQRQGQGQYSVLAKGDRGQGVRITVGVGDTFPFSAPAIMRAFHAWSDPAEVDQLIGRHGLEAFTPETVVDPGKLHDVLRETRERGYSASIREFDLGQSGVAAPVFDTQGRVSMVVCSLAFSSELNESTLDRYGALIRECGLRITERTGGTARIG
ncbi:IclR family transcriptional regulator [Amycolatopsis thermophila]|uniref:DNA-binding IclR family transcriptional regulator n=1 Tax=Amycolatopsis thermophila TaxID=206084 RepID=A0ABU0EZ91_9PSEU|nr:IclR family transcriptional regulator [Amycolatopsis thermophila]MDQ0380468.1 DNA-binding IclR family transcriptional regulator [Amycolatopsis thermophila]